MAETVPTKKAILMVLLYLVLALYGGKAGAADPSFDCGKVEAGSIEAIICKDQGLSELDRKLAYVDWAQRVTLSALHGSGLQELLDAVQRAWRSARAEFSTPELTRVLQAAFDAHQPPMQQGRTAKLRYAHAGGKLPPRIIIHGSRTETIPDSYRRYLANRFIQHFKLKGTPLFIDFRNSENPYKDRKNKLTARQLEKRRRLKKFTARKSRK